MDKFQNEEDLFCYLLSVPKHLPTCMEAIRLGRPVSAELVAKIIFFAPHLLKQILDIDFNVKCHWDYYNDCPDDDVEKIFELCRKHFGDEQFFKIVLPKPHLCEHFIDYFVKIDVDYLRKVLAEIDDNARISQILYGTAVQNAIREKFDTPTKDRLFHSVLNGSEFEEDDYLNCFGLEFCLNKGVYSLYLLEVAYWDFDDDQQFWDLLYDYPEAIRTLRDTDDPHIIESMSERGLL